MQGDAIRLAAGGASRSRARSGCQPPHAGAPSDPQQPTRDLPRGPRAGAPKTDRGCSASPGAARRASAWADTHRSAKNWYSASSAMPALTERPLINGRGNRAGSDSFDELRKEIRRHDGEPGQSAFLLRRAQHRERVHRADINRRQIGMCAKHAPTHADAPRARRRALRRPGPASACRRRLRGSIRTRAACRRDPASRANR